MKNNNTNSYNSTENDSIDIIALIKKNWSERRLIAKTIMFFFIIGCIVALLSPTLYTSQTTFVPQVSGDDMLMNNSKLGSLASLAGINLNPTEITSDSYLSPLLYKNIVDSEEFSLKLLEEELITSKSERLTVKEYLLSKKTYFNFNPISFIKKYTIGLFINDQNEINSDIIKNYNFISNEDFKLLNSFKEKFKIELNEKEGFIKVIATDEDAFVSTQLVNKITKSLQNKIIKLRTNKIKERLIYSKEQYELKQLEFDTLQKKLAVFKDSNKNISTASFMSQLDKLESEYQLQQNILVNLAAEYNNNKIKLNKNTPIFSVIDEVSIPNIRSKPKRTLLVFIFVFIGLILSLGFINGKDPMINLIKEIKE